MWFKKKPKTVKLEIVDQYQVQLPSGRVLYGGRLEETSNKKGNIRKTSK